MAAAVAGKHVHVEKPLTLDRPSAEAAVGAAKRAGIVLAVGFNRRFHPSVVEIRKRLADGSLGKVMSMVATHTTTTAQ
jgi:predicted dehydrogenase